MRFNVIHRLPLGAAWLPRRPPVYVHVLIRAKRKPSAKSPRGARAPLRVAYLSTSATMAPVWMAKDSGGVRKRSAGHGSSFHVFQQCHPCTDCQRN